MKKLGLIGWRGMVGSVLLQRMQQEDDFRFVQTTYFSTSQSGGVGPDGGTLLDAHHIPSLAEQDIIISCQGGEYTNTVFEVLRTSGWQGYWIDAASALRMREDACIVLDPVNRDVIDTALNEGVKNFIGGNCTVSLLLMGIGQLFHEGLVSWVSTMTYQAASGAGARQVRELLEQSKAVCEQLPFDHPETTALHLESMARAELSSSSFPTTALGFPLAMNLLPYIDKEYEGGQSREEWKGRAEVNKILGLSTAVPVDGVCVRVPVLRSHAQAFTVKLSTPLPVPDIEKILRANHDWVQVVPNERELSLRHLTPAAVSGTLRVAVGRLRIMNIGEEYLTGFTVGDQLLWGAAEPLRRMLRILCEAKG